MHDKRTPLLAVPWMHAELYAGPLPAQVRLLDPGLGGEEGGEALFRPDDLPLSGRELARQLNGLRLLGEQFTKPEELRAFARSGLPGLSRARGMSDGEERDLKLFLQDQGVEPARMEESAQAAEASAESRLHAQLVLLLAWSMEVRALELRGIDGRLRQALDGFGQALGLEEGEDVESGGFSEFSRDYSVDSSDEALPSWPLVLEWMFALAPAGAVFLTLEPELVEAWTEAGAEFRELDQAAREELGLDEEFAQGWKWTSAPGRLFAGRPLAMEPPRLAREYRILAPAELF